MRSFGLGLVSVAALVLGVSGGASAAIISGTLAFTATGFGPGAPVDPVTGTVTFSFDNSANFFGAADGSTQNGAPVQVSFSGLNLPGSWTPVLTYVSSGVLGGNPVTDLLAIGHALNGTQTTAGTDDWRIAFNTISTGATFREFTYTQASAAGVQFQTFTGTVPEPSKLALCALGLASVAVLGRRSTVRTERAS